MCAGVEMGLDATVFCNCFESGRVRTPPLPEWMVGVEKSGARAPQSSNIDEQMAFDQWDLDACDHPSGILIHCRIGDIGTVGLIRASLSKRPELFPVILSRIVYDGVHAGDYIDASEIQSLRPELEALSRIQFDNSLANKVIMHFKQRLSELVEWAIRIGKPISF